MRLISLSTGPRGPYNHGVMTGSSEGDSSGDVNVASEIAGQFGNASSIASGGKAVVISGEDTSAQEAYIWYVEDSNNNGAISMDEVIQLLMTAHCLATSLVLNELSNVRVLSLAASTQPGFARMNFNVGGDAGNYGSTALSLDGDLVPTIALDDMQLDHLALLKIDVEGHEWDVLQGAEETIRSCHPVIYFEAKRLPGTVSSIGLLKQHGYRLYWHFAHFFCADNFRSNADDKFRGVGDMNILAVPQEKPQPNDLPEINSADENWKDVYADFFSMRGLVMP